MIAAVLDRNGRQTTLPKTAEPAPDSLLSSKQQRGDSVGRQALRIEQDSVSFVPWQQTAARFPPLKQELSLFLGDLDRSDHPNIIQRDSVNLFCGDYTIHVHMKFILIPIVIL